MVQTSSPSYLFLSAIDFVVIGLKRSKNAFEYYVQNLKWFYEQSKYWKHIVLLNEAGYCRDKSKLILQLPQRQMTGIQLNDILIKSII